MKRLSSWGLLLFLAGGSGVGSLPAATIEPVGAAGHDREFVFRLVTPAVTIGETRNGSARLDIEGFGTRQRRPGAPDIPHKTILVAIPLDAVPRLEVRPLGERLQREIVPLPVPRLSTEFAPAAERGQRAIAQTDPGIETGFLQTERFDRDPTIYTGKQPFPREIAWLGETGFLRHQRYVEVHVAPVRFDPSLPGLRVSSEVELVVHFDGAGAVAAGGTPTGEAGYEPIYRRAFVNYEQGRAYRVDPGGDERAAAEAATIRTPLATPRRRVKVGQDGVVRLEYGQFDAEFLSHDLSNWRLTNRGLPVPLQIFDDGDDLLEPGEWVQFFGQALDDEPAAELDIELSGEEPDLFRALDFTDTNIYFLEVDTEIQPAMTERDATPTFSRTPPDHFAARARVEADDAYRPLADADPWYWLPTLVANGTPQLRGDAIALPGLHDGTLPARVLVNVRGLTEADLVDPDHHTRVVLRNAALDALETHDAMFDGRVLQLHDFIWTYPGSGPQLSSPARVDLEAMVVPGAENDVILDYVQIEYRRSFTAEGDLLFFEWPDEDAEFIVSGLADATAEIYEITPTQGQNVVLPVRLTGASVGQAPPQRFYEGSGREGGTNAVRFRMDNDPALADGTARRFVVAGASAVIRPGFGEFEPDTVSDLRDNVHQADLIVIAHPDVLDAAPASPLSNLLAYRATPQGGGLTSKIVLMQDIQDEFNDGLPGPDAIREFLRWVMSTAAGEGWAAPKPRFVLLLGDGTFDYKGGTAAGEFVPTQIVFKDVLQLGYFASDNLMAAVVGSDPLPDLLIGRLPARDVAGANLMLQKILDYEQAPPAGNWRNHVLMASDRGKIGFNPGEALDFEETNQQALDVLDPQFTSRNLRYYTDYWSNAAEPTPIETMRQEIKDAINGVDGVSDGAAVFQYIGHGNFVVFSDDAFWDERFLPRDSDDLGNGQRLPWVMVHNCLAGGFHLTNYNTVGENLLTLGAGGAIGVFSPSGLSFNNVGRFMTNLIWPRMFGLEKERSVEVLVMGGLTEICTQGAFEACRNYILQGDPAMRLALRSVEAASQIQAIGGDGVVNLSWTASGTPGAEYDVYRNTAPAGIVYQKVNGAPITGTSFPDTTVSNGVTYYYYLVARDGDGFESRRSNFNSDCDIDGPDCVKARPLNPNPPSAPTGVTFTDPGIGTMLKLTWNANPEDDISRYTVHYGTQPDVYDFSVALGDTTTFTLRGLTEGEVYYAAVSATNTSDLVSALSTEVNDFPVFGLGLRAPRFIDDLRMSKSGNDAVVSWTEVTSDVFGKPKTVAGYTVWRGESLPFDNASFVQLGSCPAPCTSFTDPDVLDDGSVYKYRVQAFDAQSNAGGFGSELPASTTLTLEKALTPGSVRLTWPAVTGTVDGRPVELLGYRVYAAGQPFTRADIRDGLVSPLTTTPATSFVMSPQVEDRYYSVLAVDVRGNLSPF